MRTFSIIGLTTLGITAANTSFAGDHRKDRSEREYTAERDHSMDRDEKPSDEETRAWDYRESTFEPAVMPAEHCPDEDVYFDGACRDEEWVYTVTFGGLTMAAENAAYGGKTEMVPGNYLYRTLDDTVTVISDDQVSSFDRPMSGQSVSGYWVNHEWVIEEVLTDDGILAIGTRFEPNRSGGKTGLAWLDTDSFEWNPDYEFLTWIDGEPLVTPLPIASRENGCIEENAAVLSALFVYIGALNTGNWWAVGGLSGALGLAYANLLDCLDLPTFESDDDEEEDAS